MSSDIKLKQDENGTWDIDFLNGDFELTDSLDTAVYMSVFCEKRASSSEVKEPRLRRGHFTNEFSNVQGYEIGSKLWLFTQQAKNTEKNLASIEETITNGLKWMIEDNIISKSDVKATKENTRVRIEITLTSKTKEASNYYNMFVNTFNGN